MKLPTTYFSVSAEGNRANFTAFMSWGKMSDASIWDSVPDANFSIFRATGVELTWVWIAKWSDGSFMLISNDGTYEWLKGREVVQSYRGLLSSNEQVVTRGMECQCSHNCWILNTLECPLHSRLCVVKQLYRHVMRAWSKKLLFWMKGKTADFLEMVIQSANHRVSISRPLYQLRILKVIMGVWFCNHSINIEYFNAWINWPSGDKRAIRTESTCSAWTFVWSNIHSFILIGHHAWAPALSFIVEIKSSIWVEMLALNY